VADVHMSCMHNDSLMYCTPGVEVFVAFVAQMRVDSHEDLLLWLCFWFAAALLSCWLTVGVFGTAPPVVLKSGVVDSFTSFFWILLSSSSQGTVGWGRLLILPPMPVSKKGVDMYVSMSIHTFLLVSCNIGWFICPFGVMDSCLRWFLLSQVVWGFKRL
jgi:hypothetical protein